MKILNLIPFVLISLFLNNNHEQSNFSKNENFRASITAPADIIILCDIEVDTNKLKSTTQDYLGTISHEKNKRLIIQSKVCESFCDPDLFINYPGIRQVELSQIACAHFNALYDPNNPSKQNNLEFGDQGYSEGFDTFRIVLIDKRKCELGLIQRIFIGINNNIDIASDTQNIWIIPCKRFFIDQKNLCNPDDDLIWNEPYCDSTYISKVIGCGAVFDSNSTPRLKNIECQLLSVEFRDEIFTTTKPACFLIQRTWVIIDWCIYDPFININKGRYEIRQKIEITDLNKPVITCDVGPCEPIVLINGQCHAPIKLTAEATDNCSPKDWLLWEYKIDLFNDGVGKYSGYDLQVGKLSKKAKQSGDTLEFADNPYAKNPKDPFEASGTYPLGIHKICWFVEDGCGNVGVCCTLFEVKDCVAPTLKVKDKYNTQLLIACVDFFPQDLILEASDQCTKKEYLKFYFDGDPNKTSIRVCCDDFVASQATNCGELHLKSELWCEDEAGNKSFVSASIIIFDTISICPNSDLHQKLIKVQNHKSNKLSEVYISQFVTVEHRRAYIFCQDAIIREYCKNNPFKISKNSYYGTDVLDLILLNEHILGKSNFKYFEYFTGDLNQSQSITALDKSILNKLILDRQLKEWKFFQKEDSTPLKDFNTFDCLDSCNIIGIMNGDVSLDALTGCYDSLVIPSNCIEFRINNDEVFQNTVTSYPVYSKSTLKLKGFQLDFALPHKNSSIMGISSNYSNLEFNISKHSTGDSLVRIICIEINGENFLPDPSKPFFNLSILSSSSGKFSEFFQLDNKLQENAAYDLNNSKYGICLDYSTDVSDVNQKNKIEVYPNPAKNKIFINYLNDIKINKYELYNINGRSIQFSVNKELNRIELPTGISEGIYFLKIFTDNGIIINKILIN